MFHRVLLVQEGTPPNEAAVARFLTRDCGFQCESADWDFLRSDTAEPCDADLVVAVAVPQSARALEFFGRLHQHRLAAPVLAVLPPRPSQEVLSSILPTVDDFVLCPVREKELLHRVQRILGPPVSDLEAAQDRLTKEFGLHRIIGKDPRFLQAIRLIPRVARVEAPLLITGDTGTGKDLFARAVHHHSRRRHFPFIPVDCGAVPVQLFENELFGHTRGAFTDARAEQKGLVAMAKGGILFLDEIDSLSLPAQSKLLRFLEDSSYKPLGADSYLEGDVRVIAASNQDVEGCVRRKEFRSDLFFRLNVLRLHLPPLRERRADIPLLASFFVESFSQPEGHLSKQVSRSAMQILQHYDWPGNVRELWNVLRAAVLLSQGRMIHPRDLRLPIVEQGTTTPKCFNEARDLAIESFERFYVADLLQKHRGNVTQAALAAKKDRRAFGRLVKKYKIERERL